VARFVQSRPDVVDFFRHVDIPDEMIFQTVLVNSELAGSVVNDNLRYIDWTRVLGPALLEARDLPALGASPKLFARKFDVSHDADVLDLIDAALLREPERAIELWCGTPDDGGRRSSMAEAATSYGARAAPGAVWLVALIAVNYPIGPNDRSTGPR
jgi:hypothetical protein